MNLSKHLKNDCFGHVLWRWWSIISIRYLIGWCRSHFGDFWSCDQLYILFWFDRIWCFESGKVISSTSFCFLFDDTLQLSQWKIADWLFMQSAMRLRNITWNGRSIYIGDPINKACFHSSDIPCKKSERVNFVWSWMTFNAIYRTEYQL